MKASPRGVLRAFGRDEGGTTALEFALLGIPFFAIIGAILETAFVFLASQVLDSAVQDASRLVATGQAQSLGYNDVKFNTAVCNELYNLFDCTKLEIRVEPVTTFTLATTPHSPLDPVDSSKWTLKPLFQPGTGSQVIMVQVYYKWPVFISFGGFDLGTSSSDRTRLLGTVRVFANEPFTS